MIYAISTDNTAAGQVYLNHVDTKLTNQGYIESTSIVTDVLFFKHTAT